MDQITKEATLLCKKKKSQLSRIDLNHLLRNKSVSTTKSDIVKILIQKRNFKEMCIVFPKKLRNYERR